MVKVWLELAHRSHYTSSSSWSSASIRQFLPSRDSMLRLIARAPLYIILPKTYILIEGQMIGEEFSLCFFFYFTDWQACICNPIPTNCPFTQLLTARRITCMFLRAEMPLGTHLVNEWQPEKQKPSVLSIYPSKRKKKKKNKSKIQTPTIACKLLADMRTCSPKVQTSDQSSHCFIVSRLTLHRCAR